MRLGRGTKRTSLTNRPVRAAGSVTGMCRGLSVRLGAPRPGGIFEEGRMHEIEADLAADMARILIDELEAYLAKVAAFEELHGE